jgi:hypothetical protein
MESIAVRVVPVCVRPAEVRVRDGRPAREAFAMRRVFFMLVVVLLLLVVGVAGLGYYRDWYHFGKTANPETGEAEFKVTIDQQKVKSDVEKARHQVSGQKPPDDQ